jgi:hypothetical protein
LAKLIHDLVLLQIMVQLCLPVIVVDRVSSPGQASVFPLLLEKFIHRFCLLGIMV